MWWLKKRREPIDPYGQRHKHQKFYQSPEWQRTRKIILQRGICERCEKNGLIIEGTEVNHIIPIDEDWSLRLSIENLELVCKPCHGGITANEQKEKRTRMIDCIMDDLNKFDNGNEWEFN